MERQNPVTDPMTARNEGIENFGMLPQIDINRLLGNPQAESDSFIVAKRARRAEPTKGFPMRVRQSRHPVKTSEELTASERSSDPSHADHWVTTEAKLEKSPFHRGNTAGGRKPPYKPEYAIKAKTLCERGATTDELAEELGVLPQAIRSWQRNYEDFRKACALTPAHSERIKKMIADSAAAGNIGAAKYWDSNHQSEGEDTLALLVKQLGHSHTSRVQPQYTGPDGMMMSLEEHRALGGISGREIDWSQKSPEETNQSKRRLIEMRRKP
jgi:hypothetical protein